MYVKVLSNVPAPDYRAYLGEVPDGDAGTAVTLNIMKQVRNVYRRLPWVRALAADLTREVPQKSYVGQVRALFDFVQNRIRYVHDPVALERLQTPEVTLKERAGDCDDKSILLATLLESVGHPTRFIAVATGNSPSLNHVFVETRIGPEWVALDATEPFPMGWRPQRINRMKIVS